MSLESVLASPHLPTLPAVAARVVALAPRDDVTIDEIASIVGSDPALAVKLLRTANSALYARSRPARTVREAVLVLGLRSVRALALSFSLVDDRRRGSTHLFNYDQFWNHSIAAACVSRTLAGFSGSWCREEAFLAGLLHGIGRLALAQSDGDRYCRISEAAAGDRAKLREMEEEAYGFDHAALGAALAERWALPPELVLSTRQHLDPDISAPADRPFSRVVNTAAIGADALVGGAQQRGQIQEFRSRCGAWWGSQPSDADALLAQASDDAAVTHALLDLHVSNGVSSVEILALANEELAHLSLLSAEEASKLEGENHELRVAASSDPLTGIANRRYCDEFLETQVRIAGHRKRPLALLMVDLDHFKAINDAFGHQAGDAVLVETATILQQCVRASDLVARVGGEEFAVVLPGTKLSDALALAERIRMTVERTPIRVAPGKEARITVSIGVAGCDRKSGCNSADLSGDADAALYRAKRAGRNRVLAGLDQAA